MSHKVMPRAESVPKSTHTAARGCYLPEQPCLIDAPATRAAELGFQLIDHTENDDGHSTRAEQSGQASEGG